MDKRFKLIIINGFITRLDPMRDEWKKIWKKQLKGLEWDYYLSWLVDCVATIIKDKDIIAMEFKKEFKTKTKDYHVTLIFEGGK